MSSLYFTQEKINEIEYQLAHTLLQGIDDGSIEFKDAREMAQFILLRINRLKTDVDYFQFYKDLSSKWSVFKNFANHEAITYKSSTEESKKIESIKEKLSKFAQN